MNDGVSATTSGPVVLSEKYQKAIDSLEEIIELELHKIDLMRQLKEMLQISAITGVAVNDIKTAWFETPSKSEWHGWSKEAQKLSPWRHISDYHIQGYANLKLINRAELVNGEKIVISPPIIRQPRLHAPKPKENTE